MPRRAGAGGAGAFSDARRACAASARGLLITYFTAAADLRRAGRFFFRYFYAESENVFTGASLNWLARYWHENSLGYRDREWTPEDLAGKQTILVTGDSFAAGWGINDPADRFGDVLAQHLGDELRRDQPRRLWHGDAGAA